MSIPQKQRYPTKNITLGHLYLVGKAFVDAIDGNDTVFLRTVDNFTDKAIVNVQIMKEGTYVCYDGFAGRTQEDPRNGSYVTFIDITRYTSDAFLAKLISNNVTMFGAQAVDLDEQLTYIFGISCSGSIVKFVRFNRWYAHGGKISLGTASIATMATDTAFASGGFAEMIYAYGAPGEVASGFRAFLMDPFHGSPGDAKAVIEIDVAPEGEYYVDTRYIYTDGSWWYPYRPILSSNKPGPSIHDYDMVTWGMIDFAVDSSGKPVQYLCHVAIYGDNPFSPGAIQRQVDYARSRGFTVFTPPYDIDAIYTYIKSKRPEIMITKNELRYQIIGAEELEIDAVADFYERELIDLNRIRGVQDWELENTIKMWINRGRMLGREEAVNKLISVLRK